MREVRQASCDYKRTYKEEAEQKTGHRANYGVQVCRQERSAAGVDSPPAAGDTDTHQDLSAHHIRRPLAAYRDQHTLVSLPIERAPVAVLVQFPSGAPGITCIKPWLKQ